MTPLCRTVIFALAVALAPAAGAQEPTEPPSVSALIITREPEALAPKVGAGAPELTSADIAHVQEVARDAIIESREAVRRCSPQEVIGILRPNTLKSLMAEVYREERDAALTVQARTEEAQAATEAAQAMRREVMSGRPTARAVIDAELRRQAAINALVQARDDLATASEAIGVMQRKIQEQGLPPPESDGSERTVWQRNTVDRVRMEVALFKAVRGVERRKRSPSSWDDLGLEALVVRTGQDDRGPFLSVSGQIKNTRRRTINIPPVEIVELDVSGFALSTVVAEGRGRIPAGETVPFGYQLRPRAARAQSVRVTFASGNVPPPRLPATAPIAPGLDCGS